MAPQPEFANGTSGAVNFNNGPAQSITPTSGGVTAITFSNAVSGNAYVLKLVQGGAGGNTFSWPVSVKWAQATALLPTPTAGKVDLVNFYYDGTSFHGTYALSF